VLLSVAKILQGVASGVPFGGKEPYMAPANAFLETNRADLVRAVSILWCVPRARGAARGRRVCTCVWGGRNGVPLAARAAVVRGTRHRSATLGQGCSRPKLL
jgi:hypothetical protein